MKKQITFIAIALAIFGLCASAKAEVDLTMKGGIYLTGKKYSIDFANDRFVAKSTRVDVFTDQAAAFVNGYYVFHIGAVGLRSGAVYTPLETYMQFYVVGLGLEITSKEMIFNGNRKWSNIVVPVSLKSGSNRLVLSIDPSKKLAESNEDNNLLWVNVVVNQRFPSAGPK